MWHPCVQSREQPWGIFGALLLSRQTCCKSGVSLPRRETRSCVFWWVLGSEAAAFHLHQHHLTSSHLLRGSESCHTPTWGLLQSVRAPGTHTQLPWREVSGGDASSSQTCSLPSSHQQSTGYTRRTELRSSVTSQRCSWSLPTNLPRPELKKHFCTAPPSPPVVGASSPAAGQQQQSLSPRYPPCLQLRSSWKHTPTQSWGKVSLQIEMQLLLAWLEVEIEHDDGSRFEENHKGTGL